MKTVLHLALSADGFIATPEGDSSWVSSQDEELFKARAREFGCLVVGKRTFEQYQGSIYPVEGAHTIVLSSTGSDKEFVPGVSFASSPQNALDLALQRGCETLLVAGGARTSSIFLSQGHIDEAYLSIHPLVLGSGMSPFAEVTGRVKLERISTRDLLEGVVELRYRVVHTPLH